jgi:hypothetical protein
MESLEDRQLPGGRPVPRRRGTRLGVCCLETRPLNAGAFGGCEGQRSSSAANGVVRRSPMTWRASGPSAPRSAIESLLHRDRMAHAACPTSPCERRIFRCQPSPDRLAMSPRVRSATPSSGRLAVAPKRYRTSSRSVESGSETFAKKSPHGVLPSKPRPRMMRCSGT